MVSKFTENLDFARQLLKVYQSQGTETFLALLRRQAEIIADDCGGDAREVNNRLLTIVFGILSALYVHDSERIMRRHLAISENFINEASLDTKISFFLRDLGGFLADFEAERQERAFSEKLLLFLTSCTLRELQDVTVQSLAERFAYHPNYLSNKFKREQSTTIQQAFIHEKLNRALLLLKDTEERLTVKELAWKMGFSDTAYFSQVFRKRFGVLPSEVRG